MAVQRVVGWGLMTHRRNVPVSATKYPKPPYSNLVTGSEVSSPLIEKTTYIFTRFEELQGVRADTKCYRNMAYAEAAVVFALRRQYVETDSVIKSNSIAVK
jgi:hypothetical protein